MTDDRRLEEIRERMKAYKGGRDIWYSGEMVRIIAHLLERLERAEQFIRTQSATIGTQRVWQEESERDLSVIRTRLEEVEKLIVTAITRASVGAEFIGVLREALGTLRGEPVVEGS